MAKRKRPKKRGKAVTVVILLATSALIGIALWALRYVAQQGSPTAPETVAPTVQAHPREQIAPSERKRLEAVLKQTEEQDKGGASAN